MRRRAAFGNSERSRAGSVKSGSSAATADAAMKTLRNEAANRPDFGILSIDLHFYGSVPRIVTGALRVIAEQVLRAQVLFELRIRQLQLFRVADEVRDSACLRGESLHLRCAADVAESQSDADEVKRHARGPRVHQHVVVGKARAGVFAVRDDDHRLPAL